jgi:treble-clef zinc-finger protein
MMSAGSPTTGGSGTVHALTEKQVRRSFVNCSRGEAEGMTLPRTFTETPWEELVVLG